MLQDLRFAFRTLRQRPSTTAVAVLTLALGIAVNTVVFSLVQAMLLRPLDFRDADRLVRVYATQDVSGGDRLRVTHGAFYDWRRQSRSFAALVAAQNTGLSVTDSEAALNPLMRLVSEGYFQVLGASPALGRDFAPGDERVVVLHHAFWQSHFGGDPNVLGRKIELNYEPYEVIGVMPASYRNPVYPQPPVLWLPMIEPAEPSRSTANLMVIGRLAEGVTTTDAAAELEGLTRELARLYPATDAGRGVRVTGLRASLVEQIRPALLALFAAVAVVLVMACANVANLLLARALGRRQEIAVRLALGASRLRLARQLFVESAVLGLGAAVIGLLISFWAVGPLVGLAPSNTNVPLIDEVRVDAAVVAYAVAVALLASVVFGLLPMVQASRVGAAALASGSRGRDRGPGRRRLRSALVVAEVALSLLLLIGAGLTLGAFAELKSMDLGFDPDGVAVLRAGARGPTYDDAEGFEKFHRRVDEELATLPGVTAVGTVEILPMFAAFRTSFPAWSGGTPPPQGGPRAIPMRVSAGYFEAFGQPITSGRAFTADDRADTERVVILSRTVARAVWGDEDPVGRELVMGEAAERRLRVVGVTTDLRGLAQAPESPPIVYIPHTQEPIMVMTHVLRTDADPAPLFEQAATRIGSISRDAPVFAFATMEEIVRDIEWQPRFVMQLLTAFALLALALAATGLFAVLSYAVTERTREIGVRVAVGAARGDVLRMVVADAVRVTAVGLGVGAVLALALTFFAQRYFGVEGLGVSSYALPALALTAVALGSSLLPALRATRVDPVTALRCE